MKIRWSTPEPNVKVAKVGDHVAELRQKDFRSYTCTVDGVKIGTAPFKRAKKICESKMRQLVVA